RLRAPQGTVRPRLLALAAMGVAFVVLVTGVLELQHLARQQSPPPFPAATPSPVAVDATHCTLPVWVLRESRQSNGPTIQVGFVDTATGACTSDGSAPAGAQIVYYSHTFHKWLPVSSRQVSPDGRFYAWAQNAPRNTSSVLYIHDIAQGTDAKIWSRAGFADVNRWDAAGPGDRVYIYTGSYQPAGGFVPFAAMPDSTGIWFADYDDNSIWHWQQGEGLRKVKLSGLPPLLAGSDSGIEVTPAGACF